MRTPRTWILLSILAGAAAGTAATTATAPARRFVDLPGRKSTLPFHQGVLAGDTLYLSGTLGIDPATGKVPEDPGQEARLALDGLKKVLEEAGMAMDDLVTVQVFCSDVSLYDRFNEIYATYFEAGFPARAFIGSGTLLRGARFEVQGIAVRR